MFCLLGGIVKGSWVMVVFRFLLKCILVWSCYFRIVNVNLGFGICEFIVGLNEIGNKWLDLKLGVGVCVIV